MPRRRTTRRRRAESKRRSVRVGGSRRNSARRRVMRDGTEARKLVVDPSGETNVKNPDSGPSGRMDPGDPGDPGDLGLSRNTVEALVAKAAAQTKPAAEDGAESAAEDGAESAPLSPREEAEALFTKLNPGNPDAVKRSLQFFDSFRGNVPKQIEILKKLRKKDPQTVQGFTEPMVSAMSAIKKLTVKANDEDIDNTLVHADKVNHVCPKPDLTDEQKTQLDTTILRYNISIDNAPNSGFFKYCHRCVRPKK